MVFKIKSNTKSRKLAFAIKESLKKEKIELKCVGAGAVNQAVKAIAFANQEWGLNLLLNPFVFQEETAIDIAYTVTLRLEVKDVR